MQMPVANEIIETIDRTLRSIESIGYAFLFGSVLRRLLPESDIDILVGGELDFDRKLALIADLSTKLRRNVDIVYVREARCELVLKAMSEGILIFVRNSDILKQDYFTNWRCFDDSTSLRRIRMKRIKQQYAYGR
jgi:predicted nucleotidyltransferase